MRPLVSSAKERGITLLELMIAIVVLSVGTLAVIRTLDHSTRQIGEAPARFLALSVAQNRGQELAVMGLALGRNLPVRVSQGPYEWDVSLDPEKTDSGLYEITITVSSDGLPGALLVSYAPWEPPR
ncbi:MAG: prepilin-type N-terminal cleavage/methylation domain-containing protein [Rhodobacteraceae bacterium]|nr:prepilin-type N-terminal cleavage/methylation domain-containing protein [Paracoccaceae bacterium]